jgi:DNA-binding CsgD family transcriptional regulator
VSKARKLAPGASRQNELVLTLGALYDAALDPKEWPRARTRLNALLESAGLGEAVCAVGKSGGDSTAGALERLQSALEKPRGGDVIGDALASHLGRVVEIQNHATQLERQQRGLLEVVNRLHFGVMLLDAKGLPVWLNTVARNLLDDDNGFRLKPDGLATASYSQTLELRDHIQSVIEGVGQEAGRWVMAVSSENGTHPLAILVVPVANGDHGMTAGEVAAVLIVTNPDVRIRAQKPALQRLYGLTPAEARVAALLTEGSTIAELAKTLNISEGTVRAHLKHVFSKTDTRRQVELVHLILSGPAALREN